MCGIFAAVSDHHLVTKEVFAGLRNLEYRGYDSWGMVVGGRAMRRQRSVGAVSDALLELPQRRLALGHTRWATHGQVSEINAHPHFDCHERLAIVHNGIIENFQELHAKLPQSHRVVSQTDTELIAHLIEGFLNCHGFVEAIRAAVSLLSGNNAIAVTDGKTLVCWQRGMPLIIGKSEDSYYVSSDIHAFPATVKEVGRVPSDSVEVVLCPSPQIHFESFHIPSLRRPDEYVYVHSMLAEIREQSQSLVITSRRANELAGIPFSRYWDKNWLLVGCGSAFHAAQVGALWLTRTGVRAQACCASEVPEGLKADIVIAFSQSGETRDTLSALEQFKGKALTVACLNNEFSTMARIVDYYVPLKVGVEKAVASTKAFSAKLAWLYFLSASRRRLLKTAAAQLELVGSLLERMTEKDICRSKIAALAGKARSLFVVGRHDMFPIALETALKIKEVSYVHAEGLLASELKHGPLALVEPEFPVLGVTFTHELEVIAQEVNARGGEFHLISDYFPNLHKPLFKKLSGEAQTIVATAMGQYIAYELACYLKINPDRPRNLAKSVTVV